MIKKIVGTYRFFLNLGRRNLRFLFLGFLLLAIYVITATFQTHNFYLLFIIGAQGFILSVVSSLYSKVYQPYELERFISRVDYRLIDQVLNRCARKCGIDSHIFLTTRVRAAPISGDTVANASYTLECITMDIGKIVSESADRNIDPFLMFLKTFIHEQIHLGLKIRNEGVVERLSRELFLEYVEESDSVSLDGARRVVDSLSIDHSYNTHIAKVSDRIDELSEEYGLTPDQAWRSIIGLLSTTDVLSSIIGNNPPAADKVVGYSEMRKVV